MPAQPEGQPGRDSSASEPHQHRQVAEGFGADAERYDRASPSYPAALVEQIVAASPGPGVLDVGCGTGIAARQFQAAGWLEQVPTFGGHAQLPPARLADLLAGIGAAIDAVGGTFTMRYTTVAVTAARPSALRVL